MVTQSVNRTRVVVNLDCKNFSLSVSDDTIKEGFTVSGNCMQETVKKDGLNPGMCGDARLQLYLLALRSKVSLMTSSATFFGHGK